MAAASPVASQARTNFKSEVYCHVTSSRVKSGLDQPITISVCAIPIDPRDVTSSRDLPDVTTGNTANTPTVGEIAQETKIQWFIPQRNNDAEISPQVAPVYVISESDTAVITTDTAIYENSTVNHQTERYVTSPDVPSLQDSTEIVKTAIDSQCGAAEYQEGLVAFDLGSDDGPMMASCDRSNEPDLINEDDEDAVAKPTEISARKRRTAILHPLAPMLVDSYTDRLQLEAESFAECDNIASVLTERTMDNDSDVDEEHDRVSEMPTVASSTDMEILKKITKRLKLATRRPSYTQWCEQHPLGLATTAVCMAGEEPANASQAQLKILGVLQPCCEDSEHAPCTHQLSLETKLQIDNQLSTILSDLRKLREEDQRLARHLVSLRQDIHKFKLQRSYAAHQEIIDDAIDQYDERDEMDEVCDAIPDMLSPTLKHCGLTRMNLSLRRFSVL